MKRRIEGRTYEVQDVILAPGSPMGFVLRGSESGSLSVPTMPSLRRNAIDRMLRTLKVWAYLKFMLFRIKIGGKKAK